MTDTLTPPALARYLKVNVHKVLTWISNGELAAVNCATRPTGQPRWRITPEAVEEFCRRRSSSPQPRQPRRRRHTQPPVREWIK